uniref:Uncharacterized protein n=1 Tax=Ditylenchus dipsaci TaxID=166011 RepID=A0A915CQH4_9BILA
MQSQIGQRKRRGAAREWTTVKECSSKEDADVWMAENGASWTCDSDNSSTKFADIIYRCDHSARNRAKKFNCEAGMRIRYLMNLSVASKAWIQQPGNTITGCYTTKD